MAAFERSQLPILRRLLELKGVKRQGWTRHDIPPDAVESVAEHTFGVALLGWLLCPPELDGQRVLELSLVHDLAEIVTGDLVPEDGVAKETKHRTEREALSFLSRGLGESDRYRDILCEYQEQITPEARWVKSMDKLEMVLQSLNYESDYPVDLTEFRLTSRSQLQEVGLEWLCEENERKGQS
jgi:putative hydrolase of HD superfamily